jgi:hypothetical protein
MGEEIILPEDIMPIFDQMMQMQGADLDKEAEVLGAYPACMAELQD